MRTTVLAAIMLAIPATALAQTSPAEQRMMEAQRNLQIYEQNQRLEQVQRQVEDLDQRIRTSENLRTLEVQRSRILTDTQPVIPVAAPATPAQLAEAERKREASLAASEARLRALSDQQRN